MFAHCAESCLGHFRFDLGVRRNLLQSLAVSKYVHTAAAVLLSSAVHRRLWERQYLQLWRVLVARHAVDQQVHSFLVLAAAQAPPPNLALAVARAAFLSKLFRTGPKLLLTLLWDHWCLFPRTSWLAQLCEDVKGVGIYVPSVHLLLPIGAPIPRLFDAYAEDPNWWPKQVKLACQQFAKDVVSWREVRSRSVGSSGPQVPSQRPYVCYLCDSAFVLRKHLHAHLARAHKVYSPARHFAVDDVCQACLKKFPDVIQVQVLLKRTPDCLRRCLYLFPPLTIDDIRRVESSHRDNRKAVQQGKWRQYEAKGPPKRAPRIYGPRLPTAEERLQNDCSEDDILSGLIKPFRPTAAHVVWVTDFSS